jgi:hypothetical protein
MSAADVIHRAPWPKAGHHSSDTDFLAPVWIHTQAGSVLANIATVTQALTAGLARAQALLAAENEAIAMRALWVPCVPTRRHRRAAILTACPAADWPEDMGGPLVRRTRFRATDIAGGNPFAQPDTLSSLPLWLPDSRFYTGIDTQNIAVVETQMPAPAPEALLPLPVYEATWPITLAQTRQG